MTERQTASRLLVTRLQRVQRMSQKMTTLKRLTIYQWPAPNTNGQLHVAFYHLVRFDVTRFVPVPRWPAAAPSLGK